MRATIFAAALCLPLLVHGQDQASDPASALPETDVALETAKQRFSYGMGIQAARNLFEQGITSVDPDAFALALADAMAGKGFRLTVPQLQAAMRAYQEELVAERSVKAGAAKARGDAFLAENKERDGVTELDSGLQYEVVVDGDGEMPSETDTVTVHYRGKLLDGTEFDSSYGRGEPSSFHVGQVIPGWQQALQLMKVGSTWQVWVPSGLAYGENGAGARIGPNETLHFEIVLLAIDDS